MLSSIPTSYRIMSVIALPAGIVGGKTMILPRSSPDILNILGNAERHFWTDLTLVSKCGPVPQVREAAVSLALISALKTSLGGGNTKDLVAIATRLLGQSYPSFSFVSAFA